MTAQTNNLELSRIVRRAVLAGRAEKTAADGWRIVLWPGVAVILCGGTLNTLAAIHRAQTSGHYRNPFQNLHGSRAVERTTNQPRRPLRQKEAASHESKYPTAFE